METTAMLIALAAAGPAQGPPAVAPAFGNTLLSTYPDGRTAKLWLSADGSYTGLGRRGDHTGGTWTATGGKLCMKQHKPFFYPFSWCTATPEGGDLGGGWKAKAPTGEPIVVTLVKGR